MMSEFFSTLPQDHQLVRDLFDGPDAETRMAATIILSNMEDYVAVKREYRAPRVLWLACVRQANIEYRRGMMAEAAVWLLLATGEVPPSTARFLELVPNFMEMPPDSA